MRNMLVGATLFMTLLIVGENSAFAAKENQYWQEGKYSVYSVVDGDTFKVRIKGKIESVRVLGIDTPEKFATRTGYEECYGKEASENAGKLLYRKTVTLVPDLTQGYRDKYNRILAHAYLPDGTLFSAKMIELGYGFRYVYGKKLTIEDAQLQTAERIAKNANRGVWKVCDGVRKKVDGILKISVKPPLYAIYPSGVFDIPRSIAPLSSSPACNRKKRFCRDMNSCEEARFYLLSCRVQSLDADKDSVPCESICK